MIFQLQEDDKKEQVYASYRIGANNSSVQVKFNLRIPGNSTINLVPMLSTVEIMDDRLNTIDRKSQNQPDIDWVTFSNIQNGFLYFQTNFIVNGNVPTNDELEKYFKKCKTTYSVKGGTDGLKEFTMFDNIIISINKNEVFITKYIILNL